MPLWGRARRPEHETRFRVQASPLQVSRDLLYILVPAGATHERCIPRSENWGSHSLANRSLPLSFTLSFSFFVECRRMPSLFRAMILSILLLAIAATIATATPVPPPSEELIYSDDFSKPPHWAEEATESSSSSQTPGRRQSSARSTRPTNSQAGQSPGHPSGLQKKKKLNWSNVFPTYVGVENLVRFRQSKCGQCMQFCPHWEVSHLISSYASVNALLFILPSFTYPSLSISLFYIYTSNHPKCSRKKGSKQARRKRREKLTCQSFPLFSNANYSSGQTIKMMNRCVPQNAQLACNGQRIKMLRRCVPMNARLACNGPFARICSRSHQRFASSPRA